MRRITPWFCVVALAGCASATDAPPGTQYSGQISGQLAETHVSGITCREYFNISGTITALVNASASGAVSGQLDTKATEIKSSQPGQCSSGSETRGEDWNATLSGSTSNLTASAQRTGDGGVDNRMSFTGSLANGTITGTLTFTHAATFVNGQNVDHMNGSISIPVTLH